MCGKSARVFTVPVATRTNSIPPPLPHVDPKPASALTGCNPADAGLLIAIGPEGGWVEPDELGLLHSFGFEVGCLAAVRREIAFFLLFFFKL